MCHTILITTVNGDTDWTHFNGRPVWNIGTAVGILNSYNQIQSGAKPGTLSKCNYFPLYV